MTKAWILFLVIAAALIAWSGQARSHGGHDENVRVISDERGTQIRFVVEADALLWFDSNRDGALSRKEFDSQSSAIANYVDRCLDARSLAGAPLTPHRSDQPVTGYADLAPTDPVERIRFIRVYALKTSPVRLNFSCFPGSHGERHVVAVGGRETNPQTLKPEQARLTIR